MEKIKNLLQQISIIQKKYDEIAKITGENFNIFSIMRAESDEVKTHSRIIAEFLNPKGIHNQGSIFLKLFFEEIKVLETIKNDFEYDNAKILVEEYLGIIDNEYSEGGFIDIVIKDSKNQVVIENKIYAEDQKGQLLRYKKNYRNCKLIYLTLDGKTPSEMSYIGTTSKLELQEIILVSYRDEIKNWIEKCLEKTHSLPIIRETLAQYLHLIKKLTSQTTNNKMSKDIVERMEKEIQASFEIANNLSELKKKLYDDLIKDLKNNTEGYEISDTNHNDYYGIDINCKGFENVIRMLFGKRKDKDFCSNVSCGYQIDYEISTSRSNDYNLKGFIVNPTWVYKWINSGNWRNSAEIWEDVAKGKEGKVYQEIISVIKEIIEIEKNL